MNSTSSRVALLGLCFVFIFLRDGADSQAEPKEKKAVQSVAAADIGNSVQVIGRLGKPMAEIIKLEGHWEEKEYIAKGSQYFFRVTKVDNEALASPVDFDPNIVEIIDDDAVGDKKVQLGENWSFQGMELGQYRYAVSSQFYGATVAQEFLGDGPFVSELVIAKKTLVRTKR